MKAPFLNAIRLQAMRAYSDKVNVRTGIVTSYDPNQYAAKVNIQPEGILTGFIPIASPWSGNGWGFYAPPHIGAQVSVIFEDGEWNAGFIEGRFFNSSDVPVSVESGEFLIQHESGSLVQFNNDGSVDITSNQDMVVTCGGNLSATVTGTADIQSDDTMTLQAPTVAITGKLTVSETIDADGEVTGNGIPLSAHLTPGIQTGSSNSPPPIA